jgi:signal transduction histidine kinase
MKLSKYIILIAVITTCFSSVYGQNNKIYQLLTALKEAKSDTAKASIYLQLSQTYFPDDLDKVISNSKLVLLTSEKNELYIQSIDAYDLLIKSYLKKYEIKTANEYLNKAKLINSEKLTSIQKAQLLGNEGKIKLALNDFDKAQEALLAQLKIYESLNDSRGLADVNLDLGNLYYSLSDINLSIGYYEKALGYFNSNNNVNGKITCLNSIGKAYLQIKDFKKSLQYCTDAQYLVQAINDKNLLSEINMNIGIAQLNLGNSNEAKNYFESSLKYGEEINNYWMISAASNNISKIYLKNKDYVMSEDYLKQAYNAANVNGDKVLLKEIYHSYYQLYEQKGNIALSFTYLKKLNDLNESLSSEEKMKNLATGQLKFEAEKKEIEIKKLKESEDKNLIIIQRQRYQTYALIAITLALLAFTFGLYKAFQKKKISNEQLEDEVKKRTNMLIDSNSELSNMNNKLAQSNNELERFAYIASHDLKSPLRNIISFLNLIERKLINTEDPDIKEYLRFATDNAKQMHTLIQDVLEFSQIDSNQENAKDNVDFNSSMLQVVHNLNTSIEGKNAKITVKELPKVFTNQVHIIQLFQNLIGNALKYNESPNPEVIVDHQLDNDKYTFSVKDNGIGIAPEFHNQIFEMFKRLHTKERYKGTGIGLAVCQKIVNSLGGKIWLESQVGQGTTFYFTIPV